MREPMPMIKLGWSRTMLELRPNFLDDRDSLVIENLKSSEARRGWKRNPRTLTANHT